MHQVLDAPTQAGGLVLHPEPAPVQLHPVEHLVGELHAALVLEHDEPEILLLLRLLVLGDGHPLQRAGVEEELVEHLLSHLLVDAAAPEGAQLLLVHLHRGALPAPAAHPLVR